MAWLADTNLSPALSINLKYTVCNQHFSWNHFFFMFESSTSNDEYWVVTTPWSLANRISVCCVTVFIHPPVCMTVGSESLLDDTDFRFCCKMQFYAASKKKIERKKKRKRFKTCTSLTFTWWKWINVFFTPSPPPPALEYESELRYMCLPENKSRGHSV